MNLPPLPELKGLTLEQKFTLSAVESTLKHADKDTVIRLFLQYHQQALIRETYYQEIIRNFMSIDNMENND